MISIKQAQMVFKGEGFLSNYDSAPGHFSRSPCGHIALRNPLKLYKRVLESDYFYDKCLLIKMIDAKIDICEDKEFVFSDWNNKIYNTIEELLEYVKTDDTWDYIEYANKKG